MIDWIYIWGLFTLIILAWGFSVKEYFLGSVGATSLIVFGIYGLGYGLPDLSSWGNTMFSIFSILTGFYILIRGTLEQFYK